MKKVLVIVCGGRPNGNTKKLVDSFTRGIEDSGNEVKIISLLKHEVKGCIGCNQCRYDKPCIQNDDFNKILPDLLEADCLVFASPLYFWTITAKMKALIERFYSLAEYDNSPPMGRYEKYPDKDCVLLMTAADNLFWTFEQATSYYQFTLINYIGFKDKGMYLAGGCGSTNGEGNIENTAHLENVYKFGKNLY